MLNSRTGVLAGVLFLVILSGIRVAISEGFRLRKEVDSQWYEAVSEKPLEMRDRLMSKEPPLYPLLLKLIRNTTGSYRALPILQFLLFAMAVLAFANCLNRAGFRAWQSVVACVPLVSSAILTQYGPEMVSEIPALAFALVANGVALLIAARGPTVRRCIGLGFAIFFACITRPAFLFLCVESPLAILLVTPCFRPLAGRGRALKDLGLNFMSAGLPLLCFALFRLGFVGNFGIVSSGGLNLAGFALSPRMLTVRDTAGLNDSEMRGLAEAILERRKAMAAIGPTAGRPPYVFDEKAILAQPLVSSVIASYDPTIWSVAVPAARNYNHQSQNIVDDANFVTTNAALAKLSSDMILSKPGQYMKWMAFAARNVLQNVFRYETGGRWAIGACFVAIVFMVLWPGARLIGAIASHNFTARGSAIGLTVAALVVCLADWSTVANFVRTINAVVRGTILGIIFPLALLSAAITITGWVATRWAAGNSTDASGTVHRCLGFSTFAVLNFLFGLLLVVLVEMPLERYVIALSPLLASGVLLLATKLVIELYRRADGDEGFFSLPTPNGKRR